MNVRAGQRGIIGILLQRAIDGGLLVERHFFFALHGVVHAVTNRVDLVEDRPFNSGGQIGSCPLLTSEIRRGSRGSADVSYSG